MEPLEVSPPSPTKTSPTPSTSSMRARMAAIGNGISTRALPFRHRVNTPPSPQHRNPTPGVGGFNLNSLGAFSALQNMGGLLNPLTEFKDNIRQKAENAAAKKKIDKATADKKLMVLIAYIIFLLAYSVTAMHGRHDASLDPYTIYDMQKSLVDQLSGSQFKHSPDGKQIYNIEGGNMTLDGVSTVKDMYSWLRTTFHNGIYSASTFDGDPRFRGGGRNGFVFGQQMLLGGIRISQYRTPKYDCMEKAPEGLFSNLYTTYNEAEKNETLTDEDVTDDEQDAEWESGYYCYQNDEEQHRTPYANSTFECDEQNFNWNDPPSQCSGEFWGGYKFEPLVNEEVQASILSNMGYELKSPGFSKVLPNRNGTEASILYATLYQSKFIDLQTRYLYIDMAFWNFNVERLTTIRFTFDMPLSGAVYPSVAVKVADLYTCNIATLDDVQLCDRRHIIRMSFEVACLVVITLVAVIVILQICLTVFKICTWQFNVAHCCVEEDAWWDFRAKKSRESELSSHDDSESASSSKTSIKKAKKKTFYKMMKKVIGAKGGAWWFWNMFLILQLAVYYAYLGSRYVAMVLVPTNVDPASDTYIDFQTPATWANYSDRINALFIFLSWVRLFEFISFFSNHGLFLFVLMFFVFMSGSALSNQIAFGYYVENYSSFLSSFFTTLKALQGKLPYDDISNMMQSGLAGTVFGLVYVLILIYILAHLILALVFALGEYMKKMFQKDPMMEMFLGKSEGNDDDDDDDDDDNDGNDTFRKSRNQVVGLLSKFGDVVKQSNGGGGGDGGVDGSKILNSSIRKVESLMSMGGLFGVRKRAVSDHRRNSNSGIPSSLDPHHPEIIRQHSTKVMEKLKLFADMSIKVGSIFENDQDKTQAAIAKLIDSADIGTGQLRLDVVLKFFGEIGMKMGPNTKETLHALFGRKKEEIDDIVKDDGHGHTCLTAFGLQVPLPHVRIESLSMILLSAIPLMSGNKKMRDILPQLTKLDIVGNLASDLIEHVASMLSIHVERASSGISGVLLPDGVVHGLDLIFNMMSASLDTVVSAEWRDTAEGLLERIRDGVHSLSDYPDQEVQGEISNYSKELRETLERGDSTKMDVVHLESRMKRRLSTVLGNGLEVHKKTAELGITALHKNTVGRSWTSKWGVVQAMSHTIGSYSPEKNTKHKRDKGLAEVDDFLSSVMAEHLEEDEFFESQV